MKAYHQPVYLPKSVAEINHMTYVKYSLGVNSFMKLHLIYVIQAKFHVGQTWKPFHYLKPYMCNIVRRLGIQFITKLIISLLTKYSDTKWISNTKPGSFGATLMSRLQYLWYGGYFVIQF